MAITFAQALSEPTFHLPMPFEGKDKAPTRCQVWRRIGRTQTWATRPGHYRIPVKFGQYSYGQIFSAEQTAPGMPSGNDVFIRSECPICHGSKS